VTFLKICAGLLVSTVLWQSHASSLRNGPEDCNYCIKGLAWLLEFAQGTALNRQIAVLTDTFCLDAPDPMKCGEEVASLWPKVLSALASSPHDDFVPMLACQELGACVHLQSRSSLVTNPPKCWSPDCWNCGSCVQDVDALGNLMQQEESVDQIKGYLEDWMYCKKPGENIKDVGKCIDMMERYLIPAFKALGQTVVQFDFNICRDAYRICPNPSTTTSTTNP